MKKKKTKVEEGHIAVGGKALLEQKSTLCPYSLQKIHKKINLKFFWKGL